MTSMRVYFGTFNVSSREAADAGEGIFWYDLDPSSGRLSPVGAAKAGPNPGFLTFSADGRFLYTVNEMSRFMGQDGGGISAFEVVPGGLKFLNQVLSYGASPCFISLDQSGQHVMASNYLGGNAVIYRLEKDGRIGARTELIQHEGKGPNLERQEKAHAHSIQVDPTNRLVLVADLGLDQVKLYDFDATTGRISAHAHPSINLHPGAGPRHLDFHPNHRWLYVLNELDSTIVFYQANLETGTFIHRQTLSTLPQDWSGEKWAADVHVHPNGRFVFASNRGHDSITTFAIDPAQGFLSMVGTQSSGGKTPRNFGIDPNGRWLLAANQNGHNVVVFEIDQASGKLQPNGVEVAVHSPVCVRFMP